MSNPHASSTPNTGERPLPPSFDRRYATAARPYTFWDTPGAIKQIFSKFPLHTAATEPWPAYLIRLGRVQRGERVQFWSNTLGEDPGTPSFNVNCLKYQTLLLARGVRFEVVRATADGSPDGRLPYLLVTNASRQVNVVRSGEVEAFIEGRTEGGDAAPTREEMDRQAEGLGILEKNVRAAWLYSCYLTPENFRSVVFRLYVASTTHAGLSHWAMLDRIYADAREEFGKLEYTVDLGRRGWRDAPPPAHLDLAVSLNRRAGVALDHLVELLDGRTFFSGTDRPGLLDAAVFAYTHLLTQADFGNGVEWKDSRLSDEFRKREALVSHERAVYSVSFEGNSVEGVRRADAGRSDDSFTDAQAQSMYHGSQTSFSEINESAYQDSQHSWEGGWKSTFPEGSQHSYQEVTGETSLPTESQHSYEEIRETSLPAESWGGDFGQGSSDTIADGQGSAAGPFEVEEAIPEPDQTVDAEPEPVPEITAETQIEPLSSTTTDEESSAMSSSHLFA